jgi:hypothetical protein
MIIIGGTVLERVCGVASLPLPDFLRLDPSHGTGRVGSPRRPRLGMSDDRLAVREHRLVAGPVRFRI